MKSRPGLILNSLNPWIIPSGCFNERVISKENLATKSILLKIFICAGWCLLKLSINETYILNMVWVKIYLYS